MTFVGVTINGIGILIAGLLGSLVKKGIPEHFKDALMTALGLCVLYSGISGFSADTNLLVLTVSIVIGLIVGEVADFDGLFTRFGKFVQNQLGAKDNNLAEGLVSSSIFVCVGAMAIVGGIESGTQGTYDTYLAKTFIDIVTVFLLATSKGVGCCLSGIVCFLYEALLTLCSGWLATLVNDTTIAQMSQVGSLLVAVIGLNLLGLTRIKVANFILAPFLPVLIYELAKLF